MSVVKRHVSERDEHRSRRMSSDGEQRNTRWAGRDGGKGKQRHEQGAEDHDKARTEGRGEDVERMWRGDVRGFLYFLQAALALAGGFAAASEGGDHPSRWRY
jgi:hypothetical protein